MSLDALSKSNDNPVLLNATITTSTTTNGAEHDLSNCIDQIVSVVMTVSNYTGAGSLKPVFYKRQSTSDSLVVIPNEELRIKDLSTGLYLEPTDKYLASALSTNGSVKLAFVKKEKYFRGSIISTGITGSAVVSLVIQYEKATQL